MGTHYLIVERMLDDHGGLSRWYALCGCPCLALVWRNMNDAVDDVEVDGVLKLSEGAMNARGMGGTR